MVVFSQVAPYNFAKEGKMKLSDKIRIIRKARGLSQEGLGEKLSRTSKYGISRQSVSDWEVLTRLSMAKKQEFTFPEFLDACSFSELKAIHSLLTEECLYEGNIFKNRENIGEELYLVTILRNHISHNHIILDFYFIGKERRYALKQAVEIVLSYIEDTAMRARRIKELNGYAEYYRGAELMKIPEHYRILIEEK